MKRIDRITKTGSEQLMQIGNIIIASWRKSPLGDLGVESLTALVTSTFNQNYRIKRIDRITKTGSERLRQIGNIIIASWRKSPLGDLGVESLAALVTSTFKNLA